MPRPAPAQSFARHARLLLLILAVLGTTLAPVAHAEDEPVPQDLTDLSLEQLGNILVTSVTRRSQPWSEAAASIYVIGGQDLRRAGITRLPEALRLAPNLHVARADANQYAIAARGFNSVITNKMLVLVDGRTVYSPLFSGVFWEAQDLMLEQIDRIEVVSGPGGTLWGTNAVNGVVNVITRSAEDSRGLYATLGAGDESRRASARWGGSLGASTHYRVYGVGHADEASELENGTRVRDESERVHGGFRVDGGVRNPWTVMGEGYRVDIDQAPAERVLTGGHLLARWNANWSERSSLRIQGYVDHTRREQPAAIEQRLTTWDLDAQHAFRLGRRHDVVWGLGYRFQPDEVDNLGPALAFLPPDRDLEYATAFVQDQVHVSPALDLVLGLRLERNVFTGWEHLPTARAAWRPAEGRLVWTGWSRAVRAPSRIDREFFVPASPPHFVLAGGPDFESEIANVFELGYRAQPAPVLSYSITGFHHEYDRLRSIEPSAAGPVFANRYSGRVTGVEAWGQVRVLERARVHAGVVRMAQDIDTDASANPAGAATLGNDPDFWWTLRTSIDLAAALGLDVRFRHVGELAQPRVPAYATVDAHLGWHVLPGLQLSVLGANLWESGHTEWGAPGSRVELGRSIFVRAVLRL